MSEKKAKKEKEGGGGKKKMIMIAVVLLGGFFGGKMMGGGDAPASGVVVTTTLPEGPVKSIDSITLNLADGRLLKIGVSFQMSFESIAAEAAKGEEAGPAKDDPTKGFARALDLVIDVFGRRTMAELVKPEGREEAKAELVERLHEAFHGEIEDVYFHEFVMQ